MSVVAASPSSVDYEQGACCYRGMRHDTVVRLAKTFFVSRQPVFIDLMHRPTSEYSEVSHASQDTSIQPVVIAITQPLPS